MFLFQKIEEVMMEYSDARHAVGEFIIREQNNIYKYTVAKLLREHILLRQQSYVLQKHWDMMAGRSL